MLGPTQYLNLFVTSFIADGIRQLVIELSTALLSPAAVQEPETSPAAPECNHAVSCRCFWPMQWKTGYPTLSDSPASGFRLACRLTNPVEIDPRGFDAVHPGHHGPKQRSDNQAVKQPAGADGDQQDWK